MRRAIQAKANVAMKVIVPLATWEWRTVLDEENTKRGGRAEAHHAAETNPRE
jgi:hypothetical protein